MQIKSLFASSVNAHFASNYPTLSPLWPGTTSPPFFLVWLKVPVIVFQIDILARTDLLGPLTAILSGCYWCPSVSITPRDVGGPSGSLRGLWIVISLCAEVVRLQTQIFPGSCFSFFRTECIRTFLVQIHSYILLPRILQQLTMGWIQGFKLPLFTVIILPFTPIGRHTRMVLLLEHAPGARSGSKAPPCVPTISWVYFILGSRISTPQNAPRYLTG